MRFLSGLLVISFAIIPLTTHANGASGGRTIGPEIKCELPNGNVHMLPQLYCKIYDGREVK